MVKKIKYKIGSVCADNTDCKNDNCVLNKCTTKRRTNKGLKKTVKK